MRRLALTLGILVLLALAGPALAKKKKNGGKKGGGSKKGKGKSPRKAGRKKLKELRRRGAEDGGAVRRLDLAEWNRLVVRRPRPYDVFALFSAGKGDGCTHCPSFESEFDILADSARRADADVAKRLAAGETIPRRVPLAFVVVDFDQTGAGADIYQLYGMNSAPVVMHIPADTNKIAAAYLGASRRKTADGRLQIYAEQLLDTAPEHGPGNAQTMADFVEDRTGRAVAVRRPLLTRAQAIAYATNTALLLAALAGAWYARAALGAAAPALRLVPYAVGVLACVFGVWDATRVVATAHVAHADDARARAAFLRARLPVPGLVLAYAALLVTTFRVFPGVASALGLPRAAGWALVAAGLPPTVAAGWAAARAVGLSDFVAASGLAERVASATGPHVVSALGGVADACAAVGQAVPVERAVRGFVERLF